MVISTRISPGPYCLFLVAVAWGSLFVPPARSQPAERELDLRIDNGRLIDGSGNPWFLADVGIRDGRIVAVGRLREQPSARVIDAAGKMVAPGFIDLHSHAAEGLASDDARRWAAPNLISQGITTVVINPDGGGTHPLVRQMERIEARRRAPNVVFMAGHNAIRRAIMANNFRRPATDDEIEQMRTAVREAMQNGAYGLTAGLEYSPGIWSTTEELVALVEEIVPYDGLFSVHERSSGADPFWYFPSRHPPAQPTMIDNILELIEVGERTGAKVLATHIKARGAHFWGSSNVMIRLIEQARQRGVRIYADQYPYNSSGSDGRLILIPPWLREAAEAGQSPAEAVERALQNASQAAALRKDIEHEIVRRGGPENIVVMDHPQAEYVGKSLAALAAQRKVSLTDVTIHLQLNGDRDRPGGARLRSYSLSEIDVEAFAEQPWMATATDAQIVLPSDGNCHPRFYGSFPRKIHHYAMSRGLLSVENAVRSGTSLPAQILGIRDRGWLRPGMRADVVVFDPVTIRDNATFADEHQVSSGIEHVFVNGVEVYTNRKPTGQLPGTIVRRSPERSAGPHK